jgi:hypothetical protein
MPEKLWAGFPRKLVQSGVDGLVTTNLANGSTESGLLFQSFHKFDVVAGATYNISFTTPANKDIYSYPSVISTSADKVTFQYFEGATATGGTATTRTCQNRQISATSGVVMNGGATVSVAGTQLAQAWLPGSAGVGQARSGALSGGGDNYWKLKRNTTYILRFINGSTSTNSIQLNEIWLEKSI